MGSTGETSMLAPEEKKEIIVETAKMKTPRMPIFFGCTGNNTETTIATVRFAKDNGADGAILAAPAYICAPESDIERFFLDVADATDLPLGIYNNPPRVKSDLHWDHLLRIFKHPNYVVHKESTARVGQVAQVLAGKPKVSVMCCDSPNLGLVVPTMALGGHGTANMTGNVAPAELATISTPWTSYVEAEEFKTTYLEAAAAAALHLFGDQSGGGEIADEGARAAGGDLRKPLTSLDGEALAKGIRVVQELGSTSGTATRCDRSRRSRREPCSGRHSGRANGSGAQRGPMTGSARAGIHNPQACDYGFRAPRGLCPRPRMTEGGHGPRHPRTEGPAEQHQQEVRQGLCLRAGARGRRHHDRRAHARCAGSRLARKLHKRPVCRCKRWPAISRDAERDDLPRWQRVPCPIFCSTTRTAPSRAISATGRGATGSPRSMG